MSATLPHPACFLILVALSAFESWRAGEADGLHAGLLFWCAAALAVLAKGPVGVLLPVQIWQYHNYATFWNYLVDPVIIYWNKNILQ